MSILPPPIAAKFLAPRSTLAPALVGSVGTWLAFPPVGWNLLAWVAPVAWLLLVQLEQLPGRRPYRSLWLAGAVFWLLAVHWIRLPHPLLYLAWVALAAYLGVYLPAFVALSRVGVHRWKLPLWLVAPVVWTGLDWLRGHLMTGFGMGSLAHTQVGFPSVIQIADVCGEYGVTFVIVLVSSCLTGCLPNGEPWRPRPRLLHFLPAIAALTLVLLYGHWGAGTSVAKPQAAVRVALIQGNTLADWKSDPEKQRAIMEEHLRLSKQAAREAPTLVVWPETSFRRSLLTVAEGYEPPADQVHPSHFAASRQHLADYAKEIGAPLLVGIDRTHIVPDTSGQPQLRYYNSSVLVSAQGEVLGTYDKMHRVLLGEYIPLADWFPALNRLTPLTGRINAGESPTALELDGVVYSVNICYESAVPHLIRRQFVELTDRGKMPDVLVNLTNDAWYWGSSELEMHLACSIFRAVEMRTPMVIAANGGLSAHVDATGRLITLSGRQRPEFLVETVTTPQRIGKYPSLYARWGDWFAVVCVICCLTLAGVGWRRRNSTK